MMLLLLQLVYLLSGSTAALKQYDLEVLYILPIRGMAAQYGATFMAVNDFLVDLVNNKSDILPDYRVTIRYEDEELGTKAPVLISKFQRKLDDTAAGNYTTYLSPLIVGPAFSSGCQSIGGLLHRLNLVSISNLCSAQQLANHILYPNLYLPITGTDPTAMAYAHFMKEAGSWQRIGIVSTAYSKDVTLALSVQKFATEAGIAVSVFNLVQEINEEAILPLKINNVRVAVLCSSTSMTDTLQFYCGTYRLGLTGPRYAFLASTILFVDPKALPAKLPPGCTNEMIIEQFKYIFWIEVPLSNIDLTTKSQFGYDSYQFDTRFDRYHNLSNLSNYGLRFLVHDVLLKALMSLDDAEKQLKKQNLTLRNFRDFPERVMKIVNSSVVKTDVAGLLGRMSHYPRGLMDAAPVPISHWTRETGIMQAVYQLYQNESSMEFGLSGYALRKLNSSFSWQYWEGKPPNDNLKFQHAIRDVPKNVSTAVFAISTTVAFYNLFAICLTFRKRQIVKLPYSALLAHCGALFLSAASVICVLDSTGDVSTRSMARIVFLLVSLAIIHSIFTQQAVTLVHFVPVLSLRMNAMSRAQSRAQSRQRAESVSDSDLKQIRKDRDRSICFRSSIFVLANCIFILGWFFCDPINCSDSEVKGSPFYHNAEDILVEVFQITCQSNNQFVWIIAALLAHVLLLAYGGLAVYRIQCQHIGKNSVEKAAMTIGICNAICMLIATVLISLILGDNSTSQQIVISFAAILSSAINSTIWLAPILKR